MRFRFRVTLIITLPGALLLAGAVLGFATESPVSYVGAPLPDRTKPDGGLRPAAGVKNWQVLRATRSRPELAEGRGFTFNHAPMLTYWQSRFYLEFISAPLDEHGWPTHALLTSSADGRTWCHPQVVFPAWESAEKTTNSPPLRSLIHQRMGFFNAPNGRLLVLTHYGLWNKPHGGPGHVVREIRQNGSFGPIYFIRYGQDWNEGRGFYPFYKTSADAGFVEACEALLADRLVTDQWFELALGFPERTYMPVRGSYSPKEQRKALSYFRRADGTTVGLWKKAWVASSADNGSSWSQPVQAPGVARTFAKLWGQKTEDGRYAIAYDPQDQPPGNRWPLAVVTSADGAVFDNMLVVHGEVPLRRYAGLAKDIGPQYVRGLEGGNPPGRYLWLTYSVNKEDIWVSRVPVPVRSEVAKAADDTFESVSGQDPLSDWNVYSPLWAPVEVVSFPGDTNHCLRLRDADPYDYARAVRIFPGSRRVAVSFDLQVQHPERGCLQVEVTDRGGRCAARIVWADTARVQAWHDRRVSDIAKFSGDVWAKVRIVADAGLETYSLILNGESVVHEAAFVEKTGALERISFRTGEVRPICKSQASSGVDGPPNENLYFRGAVNPETDQPVTPVSYYLDNVKGESVSE